MRVTVLTTSWPKHESDPGGAFVFRSCEELRDRGADLTIHSLESGVGLADALVEPLGLELDRQVGGLVSRLSRRPQLVLPVFRRLLRRYPQWMAADRVVCHWAVPFPLLAQAQGVSLDRLRTWCHGSGLRLPGASWMLGRAHPLAVVADHQRAKLPKRFDSQVSLMPVPSDGVMEPLRQPEKKLIFVGRLVRQKGPDLLPRILDHLPGWRAVVVGDGPLSGQLERDDRISCLGALPTSVWRQRVGGGVGVCPARSSEGTPLVVDELRLAGVPVVVASVDGLAQRVEHGVDGWVVAGRDPQAWASAIGSAHASTTWSQTLASERAHSDGWARFADWVLS